MMPLSTSFKSSGNAFQLNYILFYFYFFSCGWNICSYGYPDWHGFYVCAHFFIYSKLRSLQAK